MTTEVRTINRKSNSLGLYKISDSVNVLDIAEALNQFSADITGITIATRRNNIRSGQVTFSTVESCEKAKALNTLTLGNEQIELHYAHSRTNNSSLSASPNKVYVKYPLSANYDEIIKMFGNVSIKKPENSTNYFFATCKDIDEQCDIVKRFDQLQVTGGILNVKVAIDKTSIKPRISRDL